MSPALGRRPQVGHLTIIGPQSPDRAPRRSPQLRRGLLVAQPVINGTVGRIGHLIQDRADHLGRHAKDLCSQRHRTGTGARPAHRIERVTDRLHGPRVDLGLGAGAPEGSSERLERRRLTGGAVGSVMERWRHACCTHGRPKPFAISLEKLKNRH